LFVEDKAGGHIIRVENKNSGAAAYAGAQLQNDTGHNFEFGLGGGSRGDAWEDVGWLNYFYRIVN